MVKQEPDKKIIEKIILLFNKKKYLNALDLSNKIINEGKNVSFFQPYWISDNLLVCSEDSTGWWNLCFLDIADFKKILGLDTIMMGFNLPDDGIHSPNERFGVSNYLQGIETAIRFYFKSATC